MLYSEAAYFEGYHFAHVAAWEENNRLKRIKRKMAEARAR